LGRDKIEVDEDDVNFGDQQLLDQPLAAADRSHLQAKRLELSTKSITARGIASSEECALGHHQRSRMKS
ncbi:MAG: hypothetical protein ACLFQ1_12290, partial [Halochromatium sp.]